VAEAGPDQRQAQGLLREGLPALGLDHRFGPISGRHRPGLLDHGNPALLLLDDDVNVLRALARVFKRDGYRLLLANNTQEAFDMLACDAVGVIVSDQRMPDMEGVEFLRRTSALYPDTTRILLTGHPDSQTMVEAINAGAVFKFVTKPWDDVLLRECVAEAFRHERRHRSA
jgi:DNA-binding NtrC family response regulator